MRREEGGVGLIFGGGVAAEGFGHYFCLSKEESDGDGCQYYSLYSNMVVGISNPINS